MYLRRARNDRAPPRDGLRYYRSYIIENTQYILKYCTDSRRTTQEVDRFTSTGNGKEGAGSSAAAEAQEVNSGIEAGGASSSDEDSGDDLGDFFDDMETDSDLSDLE